MDIQQLLAHQASTITRLSQALRWFYLERFGAETSDLGVMPGTLLLRSPQSELYMRITPMIDAAGCLATKLVVARIAFDEESAGHGTALFKCLALAAESVGYQAIEIENVNDASEAFAIRLGMKERTLMCYIADIPTILAAPAISTLPNTGVELAQPAPAPAPTCQES